MLACGWVPSDSLHEHRHYVMGSQWASHVILHTVLPCAGNLLEPGPRVDGGASTHPHQPFDTCPLF